MWIYIYIYVQARLYTYIHTYIHTLSLSLSFSLSLSLSLALCVYIYIFTYVMYLLFTVQLCLYIYIYVHRYLVYIFFFNIHGQIHFSEYGDEHMFIQTVFLDSSCPNSKHVFSSLILSDIPKTYHLFGYLFYLASSCLHLRSRTWWNFNPRSLDRYWSPPSPRDKAKGIPASACLR